MAEPAPSPLGDYVDERLRERKLERQDLAKRIGVSRTTLWRWLNGGASARQLRQLAVALEVPERDVVRASGGEAAADDEQSHFEEAPPAQWEPEPDVPDDGSSAEGIQLEDYVRSFDRIVRTLRTMPGDRLSIALKVALLDGIKENAEMVGASLPREWYDLRRQVLNGEL